MYNKSEIEVHKVIKLEKGFCNDENNYDDTKYLERCKLKCTILILIL